MATPQLVHGTIEAVDILVTDTTGVVTDLSGASPTYNVAFVDPTTGKDQNPPFTSASSGSAIAMLVSSLLNTNIAGPIRAFALADNPPPVLPLTVVAGINDTFQYNGGSFTIAPATYHILAELAAGFNESLAGPFSVYATCSVSGTKLLITSVNPGTTDNGVALATGANDVLAGMGFTNGQLLEGGVEPWPLGHYRLYISFTVGSEVPILGPYDFYLI